MLALAFLPALVLGDARAALQLSARTEVQARSASSQDQIIGPAAADLELTPGVGLTASGSGLSLAASYQPRLLLREPYALGQTPDPSQPQQRRTPLEVLHRAGGSADVRFDRGDRLYVSEYFTYGLADITTLSTGVDPRGAGADPLAGSTAAGPTIQPVAAVGPVRNVQSTSTLGLELRPAPLTQLALAAGWDVSGGLDARSQLAVPLQRGPFASARLSQTASRVDVLATSVSGADARFSGGLVNGRRATLVLLQEEWRHRFGRTLEGELDAGVSALRSRLSVSGPATTEVLPVAAATLTGRVPEPGQRWEGRLVLRLAPFIDRFAALAYERAEAAGELSCVVRQRLRLRGRGGVALAFAQGEQRGERTGLFEGAATWDISRPVQVEAIFQSNWLQRPATGTLTLFQWLGGVSVTFREAVIL